MLPGARLNLLRTHRGRGPVGGDLARTIQTQRVRLERAARASGGVDEAWSRVVPGALAARATVGGLRGGVLTVKCRSASDRFALDRWLRGGGERALRAASPVAVSRVKLVLR